MRLDYCAPHNNPSQRGLIGEGKMMRMSVWEWVKLACKGLLIAVAMWSFIAVIVVLFLKIG